MFTSSGTRVPECQDRSTQRVNILAPCESLGASEGPAPVAGTAKAGPPRLCHGMRAGGRGRSRAASYTFRALKMSVLLRMPTISLPSNTGALRMPAIAMRRAQYFSANPGEIMISGLVMTSYTFT